jgi:hypothetical protein
MRTALLVGLVVVVGCKQEPAAPRPPGAPASTTAQDALWALAPEGSQLGLVASPRGVALLERGARAILALLASSPDFAAPRDRLSYLLTEALGAANPTLAELGLSAGHGFAAFLLAGSSVVVLPVVDRDRFLARVHGTRGTDSDTLGTGVCKPIGGRYVCASRADLFARLGKAGLDGARQAAGARGDLEVAGRDTGAPHTPTFAVVAQLERGAFVVRGSVAGLPAAITRWLGGATRPRRAAATAAGFGVIDLAPYLGSAPAVPLVTGATLADLARSVAGPVTLAMPAGTMDPGIRIPLHDLAPARALVDRCAEIPLLAVSGATSKRGVCHLAIPGSTLALDAWVEGQELRIGQRVAPAAAAIAASPLAAGIAAEPWSIAFYGRGSYLDLTGLRELASATSVLRDRSPQARSAVRAVMLINELGVGVRRDGDAVQFLLGVRTAWANPDDVAGKLLAISTDDLASGKAAVAARAIAAAQPGAPFASDHRAGLGGMLLLGAPVGVLAAIAVPAVMDYLARGETAEAEREP